MAKLDETDLRHTLRCYAEEGANIEEYWHENDNCGDPECYAFECLNCGNWITLCGTSELAGM
jgi:uncharacterized protein CbrC (UPF0167 family)